MEDSNSYARNKNNRTAALDSDGIPSEIPLEIDGKPVSLKKYFLYLSEDLLMS